MATNLFGRGMDIERVNIVFNYDMPEDSDTYLHRVSGPRGCPFPPAPFSGLVLDGNLCLSVLSLTLAPVSLQVARAGRFGTKGLAITFVSDENDAKILNDVQDRFEVNVAELPEEIDISTYSKWFRQGWGAGGRWGTLVGPSLPTAPSSLASPVPCVCYS